ncbi:MAG: hypothetical protein GY717_01955 [Rhodobacteraceae bacterium]|nr:hypothetical protein [Paracoccaceae bacterium]
MTALAAVFVFTACDGNPFDSTTTTTATTTATTTTTTTTETVTLGAVTLPAGTGSTAVPSASAGVTRYETDGSTQDVTYDATADTITIDNLPFDAAGVFDRDDVMPTLAATGFQVYENNNTTERRAYKAIRGVSASGETEFTVVRTGDYQGYGFGGFVYSRSGTVTLPTSGQATFTGSYGGERVFNGASGLQFTTADATIEVDFADFNANDAVEGTLTNRQYFDQTGTLLGTLPTLVLATGQISTSGEIGGTASSQLVVGTTPTVFESGSYYAVLSGDTADEMVGIIVIEGTDPQTGSPLSGGEGVSVQETGGFIVTSP